MNGADGNSGFGWALVIVGLVIAGIGLIWVLAPNLSTLGRLPGDIVIERQNSQFSGRCPAVPTYLTLSWTPPGNRGPPVHYCYFLCTPAADFAKHACRSCSRAIGTSRSTLS